jgi:hypothetical protein
MVSSSVCTHHNKQHGVQGVSKLQQGYVSNGIMLSTKTSPGKTATINKHGHGTLSSYNI